MPRLLSLQEGSQLELLPCLAQGRSLALRRKDLEANLLSSQWKAKQLQGERANELFLQTKDLTFKKYGKGMDPVVVRMLDNWKKGKPIFGDEGGKYQMTCEGAEADTVRKLPPEIPVDHVEAFEGACVQGSDAKSTAKLPVATVDEGV
ncbi:hypothetical protein R1flu_026928 [Riccia fluitans]|uniref:Uncharacterized protein n=1 Tax=Riccia fluitans TaxID=41844 RepID=A0ABD1XHE8_9MARC